MENREASRQGDWFRIGFEPVFVDYTKHGTWFIVISLVEVGGAVWCLRGLLAALMRRAGARGVGRHHSCWRGICTWQWRLQLSLRNVHGCPVRFG